MTNGIFYESGTNFISFTCNTNQGITKLERKREHFIKGSIKPKVRCAPDVKS